jgi:hypothetical protein
MPCCSPFQRERKRENQSKLAEKRDCMQQDLQSASPVRHQRQESTIWRRLVHAMMQSVPHPTIFCYCMHIDPICCAAHRLFCHCCSALSRKIGILQIQKVCGCQCELYVCLSVCDSTIMGAIRHVRAHSVSYLKTLQLSDALQVAVHILVQSVRIMQASLSQPVPVIA